jgi:very-short-patch-repair endonuclease
MGGEILHGSIWEIAARQHGVVARRQLLGLGYAAKAIEYRIAKGRLHPVFRGVYAVGRPALAQRGRWMAAVLACGPDAVLSHESAAALWLIRPRSVGLIHISVPSSVVRGRRGIVVHRRRTFTAKDATRREGIPVTTPVCTLIDIARGLERDQLEAAINEADKRDLARPDELRSALEAVTHRPGARILKEVLDRRTFTLTDSQLERTFLPIARKAGLGPPLTGQVVNGFKVDFYWPDLRLIVETDGLRYHRTPAQQTRDRIRDQVHTAAGFTPLRFTRAQVAFDPGHVEATLTAVARRLRSGVTKSEETRP